MPVTPATHDQIREIAQRFVGAFVKCDCPDSMVTVCGIPCHSIDQAASLASSRCELPSGLCGSKEEIESALSQELARAIQDLKCK